MNIFNIVKKCKVARHPQWCGYLQPSEIIALFDLGMVKVDKFHEKDIEEAKYMKLQGKSNPRWFYFYPTDSFLKYVK